MTTSKLRGYTTSFLSRLHPTALVVGLAACGGDPSLEQPAGDRAPATSSAEQTGPVVGTPRAPEFQWQQAEASRVLTAGACSGRDLASVLDAIRVAFPEVGDVRRFLPQSPVGPVMVAGAPSRLGDAPMPPTDVSSYIIGLTDQQSFGAVFFKGERCRGDICEDRQYWYFDTDQNCRPVLAGHHRATNRTGGRYGTCVDAVGEPLWNFPGAPEARRRCDADWSAQNIAGARAVWSLDPRNSCTSHLGPVPVDLVIAQGADLAQAQVTMNGTGIAFLDGRSIKGTVERQSFTAEIDEQVTDGCAVRRKIAVNLDFEGPSINGIPGGIGLVDVSEETLPGCAKPRNGCSASLHLIRR